MALLSHKQFGNEDLEKEWECIGSGGFGNIYKTRCKTLGLDVAIKLGCNGTGSMATSLHEEAILMGQASFNFVLRVYGLYEGCPPGIGTAMQVGIIMEFMKRGTIQTLQEALSGPPPWPLAFRLAHQIALGINFLHSKDLVHQDLKPSNILLDDDLNAKLADFGLSRVSTSVSQGNEETQELTGGTDKYMPPEAFDPLYRPVRTFDIYSYGILLWSILRGENPYPAVRSSSRLKLRITEGDRPLVEELEQKHVEGLKELVELMKKCWDGDSSKRPLSNEVITCTEPVFLKYKKSVPGAVYEVLNILDKKPSSQESQPSGASSFTLVTPGQSVSDDVVDHHETDIEQIPVFVSVGTKVSTNKEKAKFVECNMAVIVQEAAAVDAIADELKSKGMVHNEAYSRIMGCVTDAEKVRKIYGLSLRSGGEVVKAAFYDALKSHEPWLMQKLDG